MMNSDRPRCPSCSAEYFDWTDELSHKTGDGDTVHCNCVECGADFEAVMYISYHFDCSVPEGEQ